MLSRITSEFLETYPADAARVLEDAAPEVTGEALAALPAPAAAAVLRAMTPHAAAGGLAHLAPDNGGGNRQTPSTSSLRRRCSCVSMPAVARRC